MRGRKMIFAPQALDGEVPDGPADVQAAVVQALGRGVPPGRQAFVEAQVTALRLLLLFQPGLGQAVEFHGVEFFEGRFGQHGEISQVEGGGVSYSIPGARAAGMSSAQRR